MGISRRALLRGNLGAPHAPRPPWTSDNFTDDCVRCGDCIEACPPQILIKGDGGFPQIDFQVDGCTFCGKCAESCAQPVFDRARTALPGRAVFGDKCLAFAGIHCQSCQDACEPRAIRFRPALGRAPSPQLELDACTGCGACVAVCPTNSIALEPSHGR